MLKSKLNRLKFRVTHQVLIIPCSEITPYLLACFGMILFAFNGHVRNKQLCLGWQICRENSLFEKLKFSFNTSHESQKRMIGFNRMQLDLGVEVVSADVASAFLVLALQNCSIH